jgi:hypothetical protein
MACFIISTVVVALTSERERCVLIRRLIAGIARRAADVGFAELLTSLKTDDLER